MRALNRSDLLHLAYFKKLLSRDKSLRIICLLPGSAPATLAYWFSRIYKKINRPVVKDYKIFSSLAEAERKIPVGSSVLLNFGGYKVCLARTEKGFRAFADKCPHRFASLQAGRINREDEVVCPLHGYRFCLRTGRETGGKSCPDLALFPIKTDETGFYVRF